MKEIAVIGEYLERLRKEHRLRSVPGEGGAGRIDLLSNDYLGLGAKAMEFMDEFHDRFGDASPTSSASRLLQRNQKYHLMLEKKLEEEYGGSALLFNSGYHANVGILQALMSLPETMIISDKLIHASAIDGIRLGKGDYLRFPHGNLVALRKILEHYTKDKQLIIIVVESVYSMDGDLADLKALAELKHEFPNIILYVDEAHGFGTFGKKGLGLSEATGTIADMDIIVGTLGKAAASAGSFVICSSQMKEFLINTSRSFIFSTALPPCQQAWSLLMIEKIEKSEAERLHLAHLGSIFAEEIRRLTGKECKSRSQIIPFIVGSAERAVKTAALLRQEGFDALPIRRPTVAAGTERIRFSLNATLNEEDIFRLSDVLEKICNQ